MPQPPYPGFLERLLAQVTRRAAAAGPVTSDHRGADAAPAAAVERAVEAVAADVVELSQDLHANPELGYAEHHAVASVAALLKRHGHDAEVGAYGLPTALRARAGEGRPRVAILAEYDALPGLGHACGHNVICATAVGAFLALAQVAEDLGGSVELIGTPAEEGGGGKELIARAGGLDEVDAAVMLHPWGADAVSHPFLGVRTIDVSYEGLAAHASAFPFMGRNALDAVVQAYTGMTQLRQHMLPTDRVHGIITDGGQKPNIVPERAAATFYLRSMEPETLAELAQRAEAVFRGAAQQTATDVQLDWDPTPVYLPVRINAPLSDRFGVNLARRGRRVLPAGVLPGELTGSTDLGNVSVRMPAIHPLLAIAPPSVAIHTTAFAAHARSEAADRACVDGAVALALTALDYLHDGDLRTAVADEFAQQGGPLDLDALLGPQQPRPPGQVR